MAEGIAYTLIRFFKDPKTGNYFSGTKILLEGEEKEDVERIITCFNLQEKKEDD